MSSILGLPVRLRHLWQWNPKHADNVQSAGDQDRLLLQSGQTKSWRTDNRVWQTFVLYFGRRALWTFTVALVLVFLIFFYGSGARQRASTIHRSEITRAAQYLYIDIPTTDASSQLCQGLLTSAVLNYPAIQLLSSQETSDQGSNQVKARLNETLKHLNSLGTAAENSTVIVLDGPDAWFQLRPEVLLRRYYAVTRNADWELQRRLGKGVVGTKPIEQTILFPAQGHCHPHEENDAACFAAPTPGTEGSESRYLSAGSFIGPVPAVRRLLERAVAHADSLPAPTTQLIFGDLFGQQELRREFIRGRNSTFIQRTWQSWISASQPPKAKLASALAAMQGDPANSEEFGMHLDYDHEIFLPATVLAETSSPVKWTRARDSGADHLPSDILESMAPFWTVAGYDSSLPQSSHWTDVELLVHEKTGAVPAIIQHSSSSLSSASAEQQETARRTRDAWWPRLWLQPHARALLTAATQVPATAVAQVMDNHGVLQTFWHPRTVMEKAGAFAVEYAGVDLRTEWRGWEQLCTGKELLTEVFRDGRGQWTDWTLADDAQARP